METPSQNKARATDQPNPASEAKETARKALREKPFEEKDFANYYAMKDLMPASYEIVKTASLGQLNKLRTQIPFFDKGERETFQQAVCRLNAKKVTRTEDTTVYIVGIISLGVIAWALIDTSSPGVQGTGYGVAALAGLWLLRLIYNHWQASKDITEADVRAKMHEINPVYDFIRNTTPKDETKQPQVETGQSTVHAVLTDKENANERLITAFKYAYSDLTRQNSDANFMLIITLGIASLCGMGAAGGLSSPQDGASVYNFGIAMGVITGLVVLYALYNFAQSRTAITPETIANKVDDSLKTRPGTS